MKEEKGTGRETVGRFLQDGGQRPAKRGKPGRYLAAIFLLAWDGLLLYMIVECLIEPVYGAAFVAVVSVYFGNKL